MTFSFVMNIVIVFLLALHWQNTAANVERSRANTESIKIIAEEQADRSALIGDIKEIKQFVEGMDDVLPSDVLKEVSELKEMVQKLLTKGKANDTSTPGP